MNKKDLDLWEAELRLRTVGQGVVGDVEWVVAAMAPLPGLNAYLHLPIVHPWVGNAEGDCADSAPVASDFAKANWVGCCGLDSMGRWDEADLRANVDPFPQEWDWVLASFAENGVTWPVDLPWPGFNRDWTVASWTLATLDWAEAANRVLSPNTERRAIDGD